MAEIPEGSSLDHAGVDRRTYEPQNCGNSRPHGQHFHAIHGLKDYKLNCPGVLGQEEIAEAAAWKVAVSRGMNISRADVRALLAAASTASCGGA
jgi:hypothetical protein